MSNSPIISEQVHRSTLPRGSYLALFMILLAILTGSGFWAFRFLTDKNRQLQVELGKLQLLKDEVLLKQQEREHEFKQVEARNRIREALGTLRNTTNLITKLLAARTNLDLVLTTLRTNDPGKRLAQHPTLVIKAIGVYDLQTSECPDVSEITARLESNRAIEWDLSRDATEQVAPPPNVKADADSDATWAKIHLDRVGMACKSIENLIRDASIKVSTKPVSEESRTLGEAMEDWRASELTTATTSAAIRRQAASASAILDKAKAEAEAISNSAKAEAEAIRKGADAEIARKRSESEQALAAAANLLMEQQSELERQQSLQKAEAVKRDAVIQAQVTTTMNEARRIELHHRAQSPATLSILAPFVTPGDRGVRAVKAARKPHSLTELRAYGALSPTPEGLKHLVFVASDRRDQLRPRWSYTTYNWAKTAQGAEYVRQAQQLLIELGDALVEIGSLDP